MSQLDKEEGYKEQWDTDPQHLYHLPHHRLVLYHLYHHSLVFYQPYHNSLVLYHLNRQRSYFFIILIQIFVMISHDSYDFYHLSRHSLAIRHLYQLIIILLTFF